MTSSQCCITDEFNYIIVRVCVLVCIYLLCIVAMNKVEF